MQRLSTSISVLGLLLLAPAIARATPNFPDVIESTLATMGPPPCSLCHQADVRTNYSVKTPFGSALKARGLVPEDGDSLRAALEALRSESADSDMDGVSDIDELEAGRDPNVPGDQPEGPQAGYGCTALVTRPHGPRWLSNEAFVGAALALLLRRRRRP